jgi:TrkA-C domain
MTAVASLLSVVMVSMVIIRVASVALQLTGVSREVARFQARSAFSGAGFTTSESEAMVRHPLRRRIVTALMFIGNVGIVSVLGTSALSIASLDRQGWPWLTAAIGVVGLSLLSWLGSSSRVDKWMCHGIALALTRWTDLKARDYGNILHLHAGYGVIETVIGPELTNQTIAESPLTAAGVLILGIDRAGLDYLGVPAGDTELEAGDVLYLYGRTTRLAEVTRANHGMPP